jgi:hypothetical protein
VPSADAPCSIADHDDHDDHQSDHGGHRVTASSSVGSDGLFKLALLLGNGPAEPTGPRFRQVQATQDALVRGEKCHIAKHDSEDDAESGLRRHLTTDAEQARNPHGHRNGSAEDNDPSVEIDTASRNCAEAEQGGQVEDVRAQDDAGAHGLLMVGDRRDRSGDLRRVGRQRSDHAETRFREPEAIADALEPSDQYPARGQAHKRPDHEDRNGRSDRHGRPGRVGSDVARPR